MLLSQKSEEKVLQSSSRVKFQTIKEKKSTPKLRLPFTNHKPKEQTQQRLTDRTERTNKKIDLGGISSSRSCHRLKHCEQMIQAHDQSINFYMKQIKRREQQFINKKQQQQNEHAERVFYLERQLKSQINRNMRLQDEYRRTKQKYKNCHLQSHKILKRSLKDFSNEQIGELFSELKRELDKRYNSDGEISRIRDVKGCVTNELILSYSKTDESLLLGDVTRHF